MSFTVNWEPSAENRLTTIWMSARDQWAVRAAADQIDFLLADDPLSQGESRSGTVRVMFIPPLGVFFRVDEQRRLVSVYHVWRTRRF